MQLYVDDIRACPEGWVCARTIAEAKAYLSAGGVQYLSLDHDLGACSACVAALSGDDYLDACPHAEDGTALVRWLAETGNWPVVKPLVHSANPVGARRMRDMIDRYFGEPATGPMLTITE